MAHEQKEVVISGLSSYAEVIGRIERNNTPLVQIAEVKTFGVGTYVIVFADGSQAQISDDTLNNLLTNGRDDIWNTNVKSPKVPMLPEEEVALYDRVTLYLHGKKLSHYPRK